MQNLSKIHRSDRCEDETDRRPSAHRPRGRGTSCAATGADIERRGPRPLAAHIASAEWAWRSGNPRLLTAFYQGINSYRNHPYRRVAHDRATAWTFAGSRLIDFGRSDDGEQPDGWPLLVVPSLVNRAYILDLMPGASLLDYLRDNGIRPLLLDWGDGQNAERGLSVDGLIVDHIESALRWVSLDTGKMPLVAGYCMGGTLALALACRCPHRMAGLALLAAPWDFGHDAASGRTAAQYRSLTSFAGHVGGAPVEFLQTLFAQIDPLGVPRKFVRFAQIAATSAAAARFVAIEDWLNDGIALNADIFDECLIDWYANNAPARGTWRVDGRPVEPERLKLPVLLAVPEHDRIVPPASSLPLLDLISNCELVRPRAGHVGMVAGPNAKTSLWIPLVRWFQRIAALQKRSL